MWNQEKEGQGRTPEQIEKNDKIAIWTLILGGLILCSVLISLLDI
jgi:hypothetical protein